MQNDGEVQMCSDSQRVLWGLWNISFDLNEGTVDIVPFHTGFAHFNVTDALLPPNCDDCLDIEVNSFDLITRILDADVTLKNPTQLTGYDIRGILYTNDYGHELSNPDAWTGLWEMPGGETINPFRAFAKGETGRLFDPGMKHSEKYLVKIPTPPQWTQISFAVDASWPGNCKEPYGIESFSQDKLLNLIGSACELTVYVQDWQDDVDEVRISIPEITGEEFILFTHQDGELWQCNLINNTGIESGTYGGLITAISAGAGITELYQKVNLTVSGGWAASWSGDAFFWDMGTSAAIDSDGSVYTVGLYAGIADFDSGPGVDERNEAEAGNAYIVKYSHGGDYQWVTTWGGTVTAPPFILPTAPTHVDINNDDIYVTGVFTWNNDFDPGPGEDLRSPTHGEWGCFLMKFDVNGACSWARTWGGVNFSTDETDAATAVAVSSGGDIYVTGHFYDTVDFDPGAGVDNHTAVYGLDIFLSKFNSSGEFQWARTWGGNVNSGTKAWLESGYAVEVDSIGDVIVAGFFGDTVDFDPSDGIDEHSTDYGAFISKFNPAGDFLWARTWGEPGDGEIAACGLAVDDLDNIYASGQFYETVNFDPGPGMDEFTAIGADDIFLVKYSPEGDYIWVESWGGEGYDGSQGLDSYSDEYIYVSGCFEETVDFDPGSGEVIHSSEGNLDCFTSKFDTDGGFIWTNTWGGTGFDISLDSVTGSTDAVITVGTFASPVIDLNPGEGVDDHNITGMSSLILVKFPHNGTW